MPGTAQQISDGDIAAALALAGVSSPDELPLASLSRAHGARPTRSALDECVGAFQEHLNELGVFVAEPVQADLLAAFLSSQFLLIAGPSGTGKSTVARALQSFFAPDAATGVIEARRQSIGPEDLVGFLSPLTGKFVSGPDLHVLSDLHGKPGAILLVEEINLSPVEGYLAPFTHGFSRPSVGTLNWQLYPGPRVPDAPAPALQLPGYPRLLGTINVDYTAPAPSPKVAARACVVLLEPDPHVVWASPASLARNENAMSPWVGVGAPLVGAPSRILSEPRLAAYALKSKLTEAVSGLEKHLGRPVATKRQQVQLLVYGAWYCLIAEAMGHTVDVARYAAEQGILHFLLPTMPSGELERALKAIVDGQASQAVPGRLGGLLRARAVRLLDAANDASLSGLVLDFWDRLS